jgi:tetratricopeptide (TPR) repeat protein
MSAHTQAAEPMQRERAQQLFRQGEYGAAIDCFSQMLAQRPDDAWGLAHRAEAHFRLGERDAARADFEQALAIDPDYAWAWSHLGVVLRAQARFEQARDAFDKALTLRPDHAWTLIHRANMQVGLGDYQAALDDCDAALRLDPAIIPSPAGERGLILNALGRFAEAVACCDLGLLDAPDDATTLYSRMVAWANLHGLEASKPQLLALLSRFRAQDPEGQNEALVYRQAGLHALLCEHEAALALLARLIPGSEEYREVARHDPVWDELEEAATLSSLFSRGGEHEAAEKWRRKGAQARTRGDQAAALGYFRRALRLRPTDASLLALRGDCKRLLGLHHQALSDFTRALARHPDAPWTLAHRGAVYRQLHLFEAAAADFDRALELRPDYAWALGYRALICEFLGDFQNCLNFFEKSWQLCPDLFPNPHAERAVLNLRLGQFERAGAEVALALAHDPDKALARYTQAVVASGSGHAAQTAIATARAALPSPENATTMEAYHLAGLAVMDGQHDQALALLTDLLARNASLFEHALLDPAWAVLTTNPAAAAEYNALMIQYRRR